MKPKHESLYNFAFLITVDLLIMLHNRDSYRDHPVTVLNNRSWSFSTVHRSSPFRNGQER